MKYLSDIKNILCELKKEKKNTKKENLLEGDTNQTKESHEVEYLTIRIRELENEVQKYKKYIKKKNKLDEESEINKTIKKKDNEIEELKEKINDLKLQKKEMKIEFDKKIQKHVRNMSEMKKCSEELVYNYDQQIQILEHSFQQNENVMKLQLEKLNLENEKLSNLIERDEQGNILTFSEKLEKVKEKSRIELKEKEEAHKQEINNLMNKINQQEEILTNQMKEKEESHQKEIQNFKLSFNRQNELFEQRLKEREETHQKEIISHHEMIESTKNELQTVQIENAQNQSTIKFLEEQFEIKKALENKLKDKKIIENKLKSKILDLQSHIQVFLRLKPKNKAHSQKMIFNSMNEVNPKYVLNGNQLLTDNKKNQFEFDKIFTPETTQNDIFDEISELIHGFLKGYNVCVFAYGQTGSGKTYTMLGDSKNEGVIPKSMNYIFEELEEMNYEMELKILEIYNESVKDLINQDTLQNIELDQKGISIKSKEEIMRHIEESIKYRKTESTKCNESSSRSHSIYSLKLKIDKKNEHSESTINFIDLAGSERLKESLVEGTRLKETQNINKSLLNLKIVFNSIINREKHIPYRDSKLTYILKNSLLNKSKILMMLNVSIEDKDYNETLCSLRFGQVVGNVHVGRGSKQIVKEIE